MTNPVIPNKNPASAGSFAGLLAFAQRKQAMDMHGQLPAMVLSYDRAHNVATVQPMISVRATNGQSWQRAPIAKVPVLALGGGGYCVTFPLAKGDFGWIEASDRDISLFMQSKQNSTPNTDRLHSFEDGRFVPDAFSQYTFGGDAGSMVIQSYDNSVSITVGPGKITLKAATVEIDASVAVNITTPTTTVNGNIAQGGGAGATSTLSNVATTGTLTNNGKNVGSTHEHGGVQPGSGNTGAPI